MGKGTLKIRVSPDSAASNLDQNRTFKEGDLQRSAERPVEESDDQISLREVLS